MKFLCELCNYSTDIKFAHERHLTSQKHIKKEKETAKTPIAPQNSAEKTKIFECNYCKMTFTRACNLSRHKKICTDNANNTKRERELLKEVEYLKKINKIHEDDKIQLNDTISHYKSVINNAGLVIKTSVSALSYIASNYKDAPKLSKLNDYSYIQYQDEDDEFDLLEIVFTYQKEKKLYKYLGDIIINAYKKEDPKKQSIWNSDTTRLTYVIRDIIDKNPDWIVDKKGVKTTKYIIEPLLGYLRKLLNKFIDENCLENFVNEPLIQFKKRTDGLQSTSEILFDISNNLLAPQIIKYIAPHFYLTKNDELIES